MVDPFNTSEYLGCLRGGEKEIMQRLLTVLTGTSPVSIVIILVLNNSPILAIDTGQSTKPSVKA